MRLIDADKLIDYFYYGIDDKPIIDGISDRKIIDIIKKQPTAYSVAKVVEELEKELEVGNIAIDYGEFRLFEIVKQGGVSDDVCEWEQGKGGTGLKRYKASCCNKSLDMPIKTAIDLNYCPYCGKKIKVVE